MDTFLFPHLTLTRFTLPVAGQLRMLCTVTLGFRLGLREEDAVLPIPPEDVWPVVLTSLDEGQSPDLGMPKPVAEWLMAGCACAPAGTQTIGLPVDVRVGDLTRSFFVAGDRVNDGLSVPKPEPFTHMPLSWKRTFGGVAHPENPFGVGMTENGATSHMWPNITDAACAAFSANAAPPPACPGPRAFTQARMTSPGTYDAHWLQTRWPGVPDDFDWSFYNQSQPVQRRTSPFTGLETVRVTNMHPDHAVIQSRLPGQRLRIFADYAPDTPSGQTAQAAQEWLEFPAQLDTVWLFPNALMGLLFWHFSLPTPDERGSTIRELVAALEPADAPVPALTLINTVKPQPEAAIEEPVLRPPAVEPVALSALAVPVVSLPELPELPAFPDIPDVPEQPDIPISLDKAVDEHIEGTLREVDAMLPEINAVLAEKGLPPIHADDVKQQVLLQKEALKANIDAIPPALRAEMENVSVVPPEIAELNANNALLDACASIGFSPKQAQNLLTAVSITPPAAELFPNRAAYEEAVQLFVTRFGELTEAPESVTAQMQQLFMLDGLEGEELNKVFPGINDDAPLEAIIAKRLPPEEAASVLRILHAPVPEGVDDASILEYMQNIEKAADMPEGLATDMYVSQIAELRSTTYSQFLAPFLEECAQTFPHEAPALSRLTALAATAVTRASKPLFDLQTLAREAGVYDPALLIELHKIDPLPITPPVLPIETPETAEPLPKVEADIKKAAEVIEEPVLWNPPHDAATLLQALREQRDLIGLDLAGLDLTGLDLRELPGADLSGLMLNNVNLTDAHLDGVNLAFAQLTGAMLIGTSLVGTHCTGCSFAGAHLHATSLTDAVCAQADFTGTCFIGTHLHGVDCTDAIFDHAVFTDSTLTGVHASGARFYATHAEATDFSDALLSGASFENAALSGATFKRATLQRATFESCTLTGAVFEQASMINVRVYHCDAGKTDFRQADLSRSGWLNTRADASLFQLGTASEAVFEECSFTHSVFSGVSARKARWLACDLYNADMRRLDLFEGALRECRVGNADLAGANLYGADLYRLGINSNTRLLGADLTATCCLPGGL